MSTALKTASVLIKSRSAFRSHLWRAGAAALSVACALPLAACGNVTKALPPPTVARDYHERHPVVLADAPYTVDVIASSWKDGVDSGLRNIIRDFVARYRKLGHGPIALLVPEGGPNGGVSQQAVNEVRRLLAAAGVRGSIVVGTYPVANPTLVAPIRLSFNGVKAKVADHCGEWPEDLASGGSLVGWQNESYWNFGCASQATLSAQVADPRDLVTPRGPTDIDIEMRMRAIGAVRKGKDPTTIWETKGTNISTVGGGN